MSQRVIGSNVVVIRRPDPIEGGQWLSSREAPPVAYRDRIGLHVSSTIDGSARYGGGNASTSGILATDQLWEVYTRVPDVRACIDSIVRRVATWDWIIEPSIGPSDDKYAEALDEAEEARRFLTAPNEDGETWQELWTKVVTDLLVFDAGVIESVFNGREAVLPSGEVVETPGEDLEELVALRGPDVLPIVDGHGRTIAYKQDRYDTATMAGSPETIIREAERGSNARAPTFLPRQIVYMRLFPTTSSVTGQPLIDVIVNEIITMMRQSEHTMLTFDADEIPPGILVLTGLSGAAAEAASSEFRRMRGKDHKVRVITTPDPTATGAKWVELRRTAKEVDHVNVIDQVRRTIWRTFGVLPVEMGATDGIPRSVGQVQLDVSSSHLIGPILEMIEAKINARILPLVVEGSSLVRFRFDREQKLSTAEQKEKAETLSALVDRGIVTRNEARSELDLAPVVGGDVLTVSSGQGPIPLGAIVGEPEDGGGGDGGGGDSRFDPIGGGSPGGSGGSEDGLGEVAEPEASAPEEGEEAPGEVNTDGVRNAPHSCSEHASSDERASLAEDLPSDWQPRGRFRSVRTLALSPLWETVAGYSRTVEPLYNDATSEIVALFSRAYSPGSLDDDGAERLSQSVNAVLDKLATSWAVATVPRYREAATIGRNAARQFTGLTVVEDSDERAEQFHAVAMGYLVEPGGLISDLRARLAATIAAITTRSNVAPETRAAQKAPRGIGAATDKPTVLSAVLGVLGSAKHRIQNWAGRLVGLSNQTTRDGMLEGSSVTDGTDGAVVAADWYVEWVSVGDQRECTTCEDLGSQGFVPASSLPTVPGGATECGARCRCVLVYWTRAEVAPGGGAVPLSGGAPSA